MLLGFKLRMRNPFVRARSHLVAASLLCLVLVACANGVAETDEVSATYAPESTTEAVSTSSTTSAPPTTTTPTTTAAPTTTSDRPASSCASIGILPEDASAPQPFFICDDRAAVGMDDTAVVVGTGREAADVEQALSWMVAGPSEEELSGGYSSFLGVREGLIIGTSRDGAHLTIDLASGSRINNSSTSTGSNLIVAQFVLTAFSDPMLETVTITVGGDPSAFCAMLGREETCNPVGLR